MISSSYFLEIIGVGMILTVVAGITVPLIVRWAKSDEGEHLPISQSARFHVAVFTLLVWATNRIWVSYIWATDLFKAQFADAGRQWSLAALIFTLTAARPITVFVASYWQKPIRTASGSFTIESPPAVEVAIALILRIVTICSAVASLGVFWSNPSVGWLV